MKIQTSFCEIQFINGILLIDNVEFKFDEVYTFRQLIETFLKNKNKLPIFSYTYDNKKYTFNLDNNLVILTISDPYMDVNKLLEKTLLINQLQSLLLLLDRVIAITYPMYLLGNTSQQMITSPQPNQEDNTVTPPLENIPSDLSIDDVKFIASLYYTDDDKITDEDINKINNTLEKLGFENPHITKDDIIRAKSLVVDEAIDNILENPDDFVIDKYPYTYEIVKFIKAENDVIIKRNLAIGLLLIHRFHNMLSIPTKINISFGSGGDD